MNHLVPVTAETVMRRSLDGTFIAWDCHSSTFQRLTVKPDFMPQYVKTAFSEAVRAPGQPAWTKEQLDKLVEMRSRRIIWRIIAEEVGHGKDSCSGTYYRECKRRGITPAPAYVQRRIMTEDDKARALALKAQGATVRNIAHWLGIVRRTMAGFFAAHAARQRLEAAGTPADPNEMGRRAVRKALEGLRGDAPGVGADFNPKALAALHVIFEATAKHFLMEPDHVRTMGNAHDVVRARHVYCYVAYQHTPHSYSQVARVCGFKEHSTALYAVQKVTRNMERYAEDVAAVERALGVTG